MSSYEDCPVTVGTKMIFADVNEPDIMMRNEAQFYLSGSLINCLYGAADNHRELHHHLLYIVIIPMWCAVIYVGTCEPNFFKGTTEHL